MEAFPYIQISSEWEKLVGVKATGQRVYEMKGPKDHFASWYDVLVEVAGPCVSPGGVSMFAPVSRASVYKRIQEGKLTAFYYHETKKIMGLSWTPRTEPHIFVPVSEAKAWRQDLEYKFLRNDKITEEELKASRPDWYDKFLDLREKKAQSRDHESR